MEKTQHRIAILADGDFPRCEQPLQALREADFVVCCDGAYRAAATCLDGSDFVVVGDGDSLSLSEKQALGSRFVHVAEQDYNDLHKAVGWAVEAFSTLNLRLTILGATGRREDHTLGNIAYLATFADEYPGIDIEMLTDHGRMRYVSGTCTLPSFPRQQVSLFALDPTQPVTATGLRWPLQGRTLSRWWQGTLNEALGDTITIDAAQLIVFQTYDPKV